MKKTEWYPGEVKPVYVGVYERKHHGYFVFSQWDGKAWCVGTTDGPHFAACYETPSFTQNLPWRGVAKGTK